MTHCAMRSCVAYIQIPPSHPFSSSPHPTPQSYSDLAQNKRPQDRTSLPKHPPGLHHRLRQPRQSCPTPADPAAEQEPNRQQGDAEKVIEKREGTADDPGEEAGGPVDAGAAELEVAEAAELEGCQVGVCGLKTLACGGSEG